MLILKDNELEEDGITPNGLIKYKYQGKQYTGMVEDWGSGNYKAGESEYKEGLPQGISRVFYENGQLREEYYTLYGRTDKYYKAWDEDGNLIRHSIWDNGVKVEQVIPQK